MTSNLTHPVLGAGAFAILFSITASFALAQTREVSEQDQDYRDAAVRIRRDAEVLMSTQQSGGIAVAPRATTIWRTGDQFPAVAGRGLPFGVARQSNQKINELRRKISQSEDDAEKETLKAELKTQLESDYDSYLEELETPLKDMEARLDRLREEFEKRKQAREELIKLRLDTLWYEANGMGWPGGRSDDPFGLQYLPAQRAYSAIPGLMTTGDGRARYSVETIEVPDPAIDAPLPPEPAEPPKRNRNDR